MWFVDGTFSIVPSLFYQLFVVFAQRYDAVHPVIYALLPNKTSATYRQLCTQLKLFCDGYEPDLLVSDFEMAIMNEFGRAFPSTYVAGCLFHLAQNVQKNVRDMGLRHAYENDVRVNIHVRMFVALAFVPVPDVAHAFDELCKCVDESVQPLAKYYGTTYVGRRRRGRGHSRAAPLYPIETWNCYERTLRGDPRTNNYAEAGHRQLQAAFTSQHPTIWRFIKALRQAQKMRDVEYGEAERGHERPSKRKKYERASDRILRIVADYEERDLLEYLRAIAYNIKC